MWFVQRKLRKIMSMAEGEPRRKALQDVADDFGCQTRRSQSPEKQRQLAYEDKLVLDIRDAARVRLLEWQWIATVVVAVAAVVSALAAWVAVSSRRPELLPPQVQQAVPVSYEVIEVIDGHTLTIVDAGGIRTRVWLRSVDAPELHEPGGPEAKAVLEAMILGKRGI